jgi:hypothetical protein
VDVDLTAEYVIGGNVPLLEYGTFAPSTRARELNSSANGLRAPCGLCVGMIAFVIIAKAVLPFTRVRGST